MVDYDPNDDQYLSTYERAARRAQEVMGHANRWGGSVGEDLAIGAPIYAAGAGLSAIPTTPTKLLGAAGRLIGGQMMAWAPITATRQTINDITKPVEPPQTEGQHLKKWFKNTGTGVGIGLGTAALGKGIMMVPHPVAKLVGGGLYGAGSLAAKFAPVEATGELWYDKLFRDGKPRPVQQPVELPKTDTKANAISAGITGLAGLGGSYALTGLIPSIRKRKSLRKALMLAAMAGAGYWGYKESDNAQRTNMETKTASYTEYKQIMVKKASDLDAATKLLIAGGMKKQAGFIGTNAASLKASLSALLKAFKESAAYAKQTQRPLKNLMQWIGKDIKTYGPAIAKNPLTLGATGAGLAGAGYAAGSKSK